ncbi:hypothetical protein LCGC14_0460270 [marine sediment metagenome]|uniref:Integration host factor subunit alpha n=1 Tax=marine sediment metagenome TaxID=412755 RepID=A0A0F9SY31_9ZZZZ
MAGIVDVAKTAGLNPVKCPHCGYNIRTGSVVFERLFRAILERVRSGEIVKIGGFGFFRRSIKLARVNPLGRVKLVGRDVIDASGETAGPRIKIIFKQSRVAKAFLNKKEDR